MSSSGSLKDINKQKATGVGVSVGTESEAKRRESLNESMLLDDD